MSSTPKAASTFSVLVATLTMSGIAHGLGASFGMSLAWGFIGMVAATILGAKSGE